MKLIKKYIDYLFWKRTWFRALFILIPTLSIIISLLINHLANEKLFDIRKSIMTIYFVLFIAAMIDNNNIDSPENPFKKIKKDDEK